MDYHRLQWLSEEESSPYSPIWVWCSSCGHKHRIGTDAAFKHSNKCKLIPKECKSDEDHCWKYIGYLCEGVYAISKEDTYLLINRNDLPKKVHLLTDDWRNWLIMGQYGLSRCIVCGKETKEMYGLFSEKDVNYRLSKGSFELQSTEEIERVLADFNELKEINDV